MVCADLCAGMPGSGIDGIMSDFSKDLVCDIHGAEPIYFRDSGGGIVQDALAEVLQFQADGVDFGYGWV